MLLRSFGYAFAGIAYIVRTQRNARIELAVGVAAIALAVWLGLSPLEWAVLAITIGQVAVYARLLRSDMVATLQEDYILMAKSKGISDGRVLWRHALRPSSLTLLTVAGLNVGQLIGGALIVEVIFHLNGLGFAISDAINRRQYIKLLKRTILLCVVLCRASSIIIRKVFPHLTITATSTAMK